MKPTGCTLLLSIFISTSLHQLDDLKNVGESSCNPGVGTDQRVQSLMFMMMMTSLHVSGNYVAIISRTYVLYLCDTGILHCILVAVWSAGWDET